jgi:hypothetical protein
MPGVMTTLKAHYSGRLFGEQIDDLAFAFIAPLRPYYDDITTH